MWILLFFHLHRCTIILARLRSLGVRVSRKNISVNWGGESMITPGGLESCPRNRTHSIENTGWSH